MNSIPWLGRLVSSAVILGLGVGGFFAMGTNQVERRPPQRESAPLVETLTALAHTDGIQFEIDGVVVPFRQVDVATEVSGRVAFRAEEFRIGRAVKKGDLMLTIDKRDYQLEVARLREELKQADVMLDELKLEIANLDNQVALAQQQLEIDQRELERNENLGSSGALSQSEVDKVRRAELATRNSHQTLLDQRNLLNQRRTRLASAKALVQANLDKAELALDRTEIRSPMDGVVVSENVEQDGYVQMGSTVMTLQDTSCLDVTCKLHMRQMHWLWQSQPGSEGDQSWQAYDFPETPATVIYRLGGRAYEWEAVLNRYDGSGIDDQTRMIPCRVHVSEPLAVQLAAGESTVGAVGKPPTLMRGMFVKVRIDARPPISLVRLAPEAIQPGDKIWVVREGKLRQLAVRLAHSSRDVVLAYEEQDGLQVGDEVVVSPLSTPVNGLEVKVRAVERG